MESYEASRLLHMLFAKRMCKIMIDEFKRNSSRAAHDVWTTKTAKCRGK